MYGPASAPMTQTQVRGAIERMYRQDLGRDPDPGAMMWWADQATQHNWSEEQLTSAMRAAAVANNDNPPPQPGQGSQSVSDDQISSAWQQASGQQTIPPSVMAGIRQHLDAGVPFSEIQAELDRTKEGQARATAREGLLSR